MPTSISRREFVGSALASGAVTVVPRHVLGGPGRVAPNDKIAVGHIGMGTQGFRELGSLLAEPQVQVVAVCDPVTDSNDYVEWSKGGMLRTIRKLLGKPSWRKGEDGCPGGREVGREVVDTHYSAQRKGERFKACAAYADFRELLDKEKDLDAVKVMTPDHLHAVIAVAAMRRGKNVLMHKPIANRLHEGRLVLQEARQSKVGTHLLAYGSGAANARIVRRIKQGVIGPLREIHNWSNRPVWPQYPSLPKDEPPIPKGFDWDLWLGPAAYRPYHPHYTHTVFRGWYDFGGGSIADMGIYSLWPVFTELGLEAPGSAEAWSTHTCAIVDRVSRPVKNDFSYPTACTIRMRFAAPGPAADARGGEGNRPQPDLELFWYDGGMMPRLPAELEAQGAELPSQGILFVGEKGSIMAGFTGRNPRLFAGGTSEPLALDAQSGEGGAANTWLAALRGEPSPGSFLHAGPITDAVNLASVALRAGRRVLFDAGEANITNAPDADKYLHRQTRPGWEF